MIGALKGIRLSSEDVRAMTIKITPDAMNHGATFIRDVSV
jgi:hypothetical protein